MGATDLLQHLRAAGLTVRLLDDDKLHVAPRDLITPELGQTIRQGKAALLAALRAAAAPPPAAPPPAAPDLPELARELLDERAAIAQFDGGLTRPAAEATASAMLPDMLQALAQVAALSKWLPPATDSEITNMTQRERLALALGFGALEAGHVADRLHQRDREQSGMTYCCECQHLRGTPGGWRCTSVVGLPGALAGDPVHRLGQRCPGFDLAPGWPAPPAAAGAAGAADLDPL